MCFAFHRASASRGRDFGLLNQQRTTDNEQRTPYWALRFDQIALGFLIVLVVSLPVASITSVRDISIGIVFLCWLIKAILTRHWRPRTTRLEAAWIIYGAFIVLSLFTAVDLGYSLNQFRGEYVKNFLLFLLVIQFVTTKKRAKAILLGIAAGNLVMISVGIAEFISQGGSLITRPEASQEFGSGWASLHSGGGTYSTYLITVFPFLLWLVVEWRKWWAQALAIILVVANVFSLYITFQRGAWVAFVMMVAAAIFLIPRKNWIRGLCLAVFLIAVGGGLCLAPTQTLVHEEKNLHSLSQVIREPERSIGKRITTWRVSLGYIVDNPLKGAGFGRRSPYKKYDYYKRKESDLYWHAHNTFLNLGLELGLPGLLAFIFLLARLSWLGWHTYRRSPPGDLTHYLAIALLLMIVAVVFRNMFDHFFIDDTAMLFWFLAAVVVGVTERQRLSSTTDSIPPS